VPSNAIKHAAATCDTRHAPDGNTRLSAKRAGRGAALRKVVSQWASLLCAGGNQGFPHFRSFTHHPPPKPRLSPFWAAGLAFMKSHAALTFP
jgi:hypothetical protein